MLSPAAKLISKPILTIYFHCVMDRLRSNKIISLKLFAIISYNTKNY